jgi:hypothetical protein
MEVLAERMDAMMSQLKKDQAQMEDRILKSVYDQIRVSLAIVPINVVRELQEKVDYLTSKIDLKTESFISTPHYGSTKGFDMPSPLRTQELQRYSIQEPKIEYPVFFGDEPKEWITQCEYIFELYNNPETQKTVQAVANFKRKASSWYRGFRTIQGHPPWLELIELLKIRFSKKMKE